MTNQNTELNIVDQSENRVLNSVDQLEHKILLDKCPHEMNDDVKIVLKATEWFVCSKDHKIRLLAVDSDRMASVT